MVDQLPESPGSLAVGERTHLGAELGAPGPLVTAEQRSAALTAGAPRIPRKVIAWGFVAAAVLALGGTAAERLVTAAGLNPSSAPPPVTATTTPLRTEPTTGPLSASGALLALQRLDPVPAPKLTLDDQNGRAVSLSALRGKVVVLTFFDASCDDACPVIAADLRRADADLGPLRSRVVLLTVNTDPLDLAVTPASPAVTRTGLAALGNWHFLTGSIHSLNRLWADLGVSISVYVDEKAVVHNDVLYLIAPNGDLEVRGSPFSDESAKGAYSLPAPLVRIAGKGLATAATLLLGRHS